jgi:hypothetical protein
MKYFLILIISLILLFNVYNLGVKSVKSNEVIKTDTITKVDTVVIEKPVPDTVYIKEIIRDTVYSTDSVLVEVLLPIETKTYTDDSTYIATISGFKANLDNIKVFPTTTTINREKVQEIALKQSKITHGVQVGVGYGITSKSITPYIGYGISINF